MHPFYTLLIDCVENVTAGGNIQEWGSIHPSGIKDLYYESIQPHDKSIRILLPEHRNGFMNIKTKASLKDTLKCYSFNKVFLNCTCRITFDNIQDLMSQPSTKYTVYHKAHKCRSDHCIVGQMPQHNFIKLNRYIQS